MAKKLKKLKNPKNSKDPWTGRTWHLISASGAAIPLLMKGDDDGKKNRFRLVVGSSSGTPKRINFYKVTSKPGAMTKHWEGRIFVPRGSQPLPLKDNANNAIAAPGAGASAAAIQAICGQLVTAVDQNARIGTSRLECDVTLPDVQTDNGAVVISKKKKQFGVLRLFQVPKALGSEALLVVDFAIDVGLPGGSGGGGSVTDRP
jgi:hypothetical protein